MTGAALSPPVGAICTAPPQRAAPRVQKRRLTKAQTRALQRRIAKRILELSVTLPDGSCAGNDARA